MKLKNNRVMVGLSGGVDSTVTAHILKSMGYDVIGITMLTSNECDFIEDAKRVSQILSIPHYILDIRKEFKSSVIDKFVDMYSQGKTPNPCVICNKTIKFGKMLEISKEYGAYYFATGHYAKIQYDKSIDRYRIYKGKASGKDQAYVLYSLKQCQLEHILMPLGHYPSKDYIRKIAHAILPDIAKKDDSNGICFIPSGDYKKFLKTYYPHIIKKGNFVDVDGNILGKHKGIVNYTIGQRRGIGERFNKPMYVVELDANNDRVILGENSDTLAKGLLGINPNFIPFDKLEGKMKVRMKICHWGWYLKGNIQMTSDGKVKVLFDRKERAVAPGQVVVFYKDNEIIGGAEIETVIK
ncbi:tRNA 2-thiouridine(34) synthase MnmA [Clostridiisalibacter paucivorans]|uniref:tRNA 2-thiouridine(34) synthase MnmA n=1 Tax=Clostridiisalibacter paucivorans TaxID=408753 RepID=UPI00047B64D7|nr:tRNA 2-thiouridine(34) synthase MnmA [Clostridiisalibacter paucivorans]